MRTMLAITLAACAAGCKSQKVIEVETEITAAKARVAGLDKKRQELTAELKRLQVERKTFGQQADEAALAKERLSARPSSRRSSGKRRTWARSSTCSPAT